MRSYHSLESTPAVRTVGGRFRYPGEEEEHKSPTLDLGNLKIAKNPRIYVHGRKNIIKHIYSVPHVIRTLIALSMEWSG